MGQKYLESWHKSPYHSMMGMCQPCASAAGTKAGKSKPACGAPLGCGGELMGAKGPSSCVGVGLKNEIGLRRPWAEALGGAFLPFLLYY